MIKSQRTIESSFWFHFPPLKSSSFGGGWNWVNLRWRNNHSAEWASGVRKLAEAVQFYYGHKYQRAIDYLQQIADNELWTNATPPDLPFHSGATQPEGMGAPQYVMHDAVLNAIAPAVPLRALFSRNNR